MDLEAILLSDDVVKSINKNLNYLEELIPEIKYMYGFTQDHPHHHLDVWNHTLLALSLSKKDFDVRLCLLLHDIGKPFSYQDGEVRHFRGHARKSAIMAKEILTRLNFEEDYVDYICFLVKNHDKKIPDEMIEKDYDLCLKWYEMQRCDALAHHPNSLENRKKYLNETKNRLILKKDN
ncbi:MAG: HD domain-containing protein [Bacilli bacterium]|nr:HD domain-containing protein [Bacilli bacterium]